TVIAAAITSRMGKNKLPTHIDIYADRVGLAKDSVVLLEQVRTIDKQRFYKMFGSALQYDFLFADTIEENINFGRNISQQDIREAARIAQASDFIESFSDGYDHMLAQHGSNLSGGQKQRVLISRALAAKPEILILDDSSSALDYKTDAALRRALSENLHETTVITVAQRVSSVKDCSLILVLDEGEIIGAGSHEELLSSCSQYREISESQMGGAFVE
ncbi:MAG: ATP-binding cassette domain-containing protein, partial [Clostridia bacterium]|nr:ATP-binding cassette domain-containing protein [Clostridia bacterium]